MLTRAKSWLLYDMMKEPCYQQLRTTEQLGYIVWSGARSVSNIEGLRVTVQSSVQDPRALDSRIDAFLQQFEVYPFHDAFLLTQTVIAFHRECLPRRLQRNSNNSRSRASSSTLRSPIPWSKQTTSFGLRSSTSRTQSFKEVLSPSRLICPLH